MFIQLIFFFRISYKAFPLHPKSPWIYILNVWNMATVPCLQMRKKLKRTYSICLTSLIDSTMCDFCFFFLEGLFTLEASITKNKARNYGTDILPLTHLQRNISIGAIFKKLLNFLKKSDHFSTRCIYCTVEVNLSFFLNRLISRLNF